MYNSDKESEMNVMEWFVWTIGVIVILLWVLLRPGRCKAGQQLPFWGVNHAHRGLHTQDKTVPETVCRPSAPRWKRATAWNWTFSCPKTAR